MSRPNIYYYNNSSKFKCECDYTSVYEYKHPTDKIFLVFLNMLRDFECCLSSITVFSRDVSSASYHRIHNQHHLSTDHLITHILSFQLSYYVTSEHWAPKFSIQTRNWQHYRFHSLRAGKHSLVLFNFSFYMRSDSAA